MWPIMDNVHLFLSFPRATIKSEGRLRAARNSFLPPSVVPSFLFFFSSPLPSFLGFLNRDEAARLAGRQPSVRYFGCSLLQRGSRNPRRDIHRLAHLLLFSRPKERAHAKFRSLARTLFSRDENALSPDKEGTKNSWFLFSVFSDLRITLLSELSDERREEHK